MTFANINLDKFHCSSPMCLCQTGTENDEHFFLHCPRHSNYRKDLLGRISNVVDIDIGNFSSPDLCNFLLYGNSHFSFDTNHHIVKSTITFIKSTARFKQIQANQLENFSHLKRLCPPFTLCLALSSYSWYVNNLKYLISRATETSYIMSILCCSWYTLRLYILSLNRKKK